MTEGFCRFRLHFSVGGVLKSFAAILVALVFAGGLAAPVRSEECDTLLGCGDDLQWAIDLEDKIADNIWDGQVYEIDYKPDLPRTRDERRARRRVRRFCALDGNVPIGPVVPLRVGQALPRERHPDPGADHLLASAAGRGESARRRDGCEVQHPREHLAVLEP